MIPRLRPPVGPAEFAAAVTRPHSVADFEAAFARLADQRHAIAFPYGRTALLILLEALALKDREIILPAYTCVVVAHAIVLSGNRPVFVDCESNGFNMDLDRAEAAITERTGAIIATSIHGYPVDLDRLAAIRQRHPHVAILQDCAHSFFAEWRGRPVQKEGVAAFYGLNISKIMTSIFGGMITTDDDALQQKLLTARARRLQPTTIARGISNAIYLGAATGALSPTAFNIVYAIQKSGWLDHFVRYYDEAKIDMPNDHLIAMGPVAASVGVAQCDRYPSIVAHRRKIAALYHALLRDAPRLTLPPQGEGVTWSHYVVRVADPVKVAARAARRGIEFGRVIDYCVPDMPAYRTTVPAEADFSVTRRLNAEIVNLPLQVNEQEATRVAEVALSIV